MLQPWAVIEGRQVVDGQVGWVEYRRKVSGSARARLFQQFHRYQRRIAGWHIVGIFPAISFPQKRRQTQTDWLYVGGTSGFESARVEFGPNY